MNEYAREKKYLAAENEAAMLKAQEAAYTKAMKNAVDHPPHYNHGQYECIDVMVDVFGKEAVETFCLLNAFKYEWRSKHKNGVQDIKKAWWYLDKYLELEGEKNECKDN